ncbi:MAG: flagellum-specific ATP synthase FliI [Pseudomonadota bacterium]
MLPESVEVWGKVASCDGARLCVDGLGGIARLGDRLALGQHGPEAEVIALEGAQTIALLATPAEGIAMGQQANLVRATPVFPSGDWCGHVLNADGKGSDGAPPASGAVEAPLRRAPPPGAERRGLGERLETGVAAFDAALPLCRGQRLGIFAGSGVGKTLLLRHLAESVAADVVVIALIGERGREVGESLRTTMSGSAAGRTVAIAETSDAAPTQKRRAAWLAMAVAEHFRDEGAHVLLLMDSVTRFAEAHRDAALAAGELPALRGFPASTAGTVTALCERAGPGRHGSSGDITAIFTVLVQGSDLDEPISDLLRGTLDGHVVLDRGIAERGRFPAIDLARSLSRSAPAAWSADQAALAAALRARIAQREEVLPMVRAGLHVPGEDAAADAALAAFPALDAFLGRLEPSPTNGWAFEALGKLLPEVPEHHTAFTSGDAGRSRTSD